jgi:haloacetate dehalogenase
MWRDIAPDLASGRRVIVADLPGYGRSESPADTEDPARMSKRRMAATLIEAMAQLGHARFAVVGHDRGGRVAYRMALDHPETVAHLAVMDIVPTGEVWASADARLALSFWPFTMLAQPAPLPERLLGDVAEAVVDDALRHWGTPCAAFPPYVRHAYIKALRNPHSAHAICDDYRAAATIDGRHDALDLAGGRRIACPTLVLWSREGGLNDWYDGAGGPLGIWARWADDVRGQAVEGGHFFPEHAPQLTTDLLRRFLQPG